MCFPPARPLTTTPTSAGAAAPAVNPAKFTKTAPMGTFSGASCVTSKSAPYTKIHGTKERHARSTTTGRAEGKRRIRKHRRQHLSKPSESLQRKVLGSAGSVDGILKRMMGVIL